MSQTAVAVLVGSLRADSLNRKVAARLAELAPEGVQVRVVEGLGDLPFYNEDLDTGSTPAAVVSLRETVGAADRVLAVTPEYNGTMPAVLNNAIDWLSRPYGAGALVGKPFGVVGTTPRRTAASGPTPTPRARLASPEPSWSRRSRSRSRASGIDVLTDPEVTERLRTALAVLVQHDTGSRAA